jgi:hypothetical protein
MHVDLSAGPPALLEPDDLQSFKVVVPADAVGDEARLTEVVGALGRPADAGHVFVDIEALLDLVPERRDEPEWRKGFDGMVAYARSKGWVDEAGTAIRGHVEPPG